MNANDVTDAKVYQIWKRALYAVKSRQLVMNKGVRDFVQQVELAFRKLQDERQKGTDHMDLAAAEHFLFARWVAGLTGDPLVKAAPTLYQLKKQVLTALGREQSMRVTDRPVMPPHPKITEWGIKGADEGLGDYRAKHGRAPTNYGKAIPILKEEAYRK